VGLYLHSRNTSSWRGAYFIKHRDFAFILSFKTALSWISRVHLTLGTLRSILTLNLQLHVGLQSDLFPDVSKPECCMHFLYRRRRATRSLKQSFFVKSSLLGEDHKLSRFSLRNFLCCPVTMSDPSKCFLRHLHSLFFL